MGLMVSTTLIAASLWSWGHPGAVFDGRPPLNAPIVLMPGTNGANRVEVQSVAPRMGVHRSTDANGVPSNGLVAITDRGVLLIDTAWTPAQTKAILRWGDEQLKR